MSLNSPMPDHQTILKCILEPDPARSIELLFAERQLRNDRDKAYFLKYLARYLPGVCLKPSPATHPIPPRIRQVLNLWKWHPDDSGASNLTDFLFGKYIGLAPELGIGQYNGHTLSVIFNGAALDPPLASMEKLKSFGVQYAHSPMFTGLRVKESKDDLCLLVLGNICASTSIYPFDDGNWFDTRFVLALDTRPGWGTRDALIVYNHEFEHEKPPRFCNGPRAFTVASYRFKSFRLVKHGYLRTIKQRDNMKLAIRSVRKPELAVSGHVDDAHPYVPIFPARDD